MHSNTPRDYQNLPELARQRLEKLVEIGLSRPSEPPEVAGDSAVQVQLAGGRSGWLQLDAGEQELGYKGARVFERAAFQTDRAILSALNLLEARRIHPEGDNLERVWSAARLRVAAGRAGVELLPGDKCFGEAARNDPRFSKFRARDLPNAIKLAYYEACLRYYRPDFDALSDEDQAALLVEAYKHVGRQLESARASQAFFEYGRPGGLPRRKGADPERDIKAAELKDALRLEYHEIGEMLDVPLPADYDLYGDHQQVRRMVERGREHLKKALGEEGYERHLESKRSDLERWHSLGDDQGVELFAEWLAEECGMPPEQALVITAEAVRRAFGEE